MKILRNLSLMCVAGLMFASCGNAQSEKAEASTDMAEVNETEIKEIKAVEKEQSNTIVDVAVGNDNFSTLVAAVKAADLVGTLSGNGPFTVFAPTNDAFGKLPEGTVETLLKPENKGKLTSVLTYHVVAGNFDANTVVKAIKDNKGTYNVPTVQGGEISLSLNGSDVILTDANGNSSKVIMADVKASNGVIHAIDTVVMPK